ncbi:HP0495 family protein [Pseudohongiella spirulinae]|uniref:UPF0250 protein PS2015_2171 n=1 Tax=Pseudohongiella spirulinae TaxID=1249552 RepID=A0A0S2KEN6_9GAMM|nr:DUF493 domain-containing protein [Pseudohongiella spirulinae]ALO46807.1 Protein YbeD [Pseudohongiella spirulinae]
MTVNVHNIEQQAPKIEFPCRYPIKVMGHAIDGFEQAVIDTVRRHAPEVQEQDVSSRPSAKGNYLSVTIVIEATGQEQLEILFADLKRLTAVKLVL